MQNMFLEIVRLNGFIMKFFPELTIFLRYVSLLFLLFILTPTVTKANVRCIQTFLSKTVFDPGPVDGAWGKKTATALHDYATYHELNLSTEINRKNAKSLCEELTKFERSIPIPNVRRFDISISLSELEDFTGRKQLDVSSFKLMRNFSSDNCRFKISRKQIETKRVEVLASGDFEVSGGLVTFGENRWQTGGLADSSFLKEQGILAFEEGFLLHGSIPYFHLFVSPGEIAQRPMQIDFSGTESEEVREIFKIDENWPKVYPFYVDTWQSGIIDLRCR